MRKLLLFSFLCLMTRVSVSSDSLLRSSIDPLWDFLKETGSDQPDQEATQQKILAEVSSLRSMLEDMQSESKKRTRADSSEESTFTPEPKKPKRAGQVSIIVEQSITFSLPTHDIFLNKRMLVFAESLREIIKIYQSSKSGTPFNRNTWAIQYNKLLNGLSEIKKVSEAFSQSAMQSCTESANPSELHQTNESNK